MSGAYPAFRLSLRFRVYLNEIFILVFGNLGIMLYNGSVPSRYGMVNFSVRPAAAARLIGFYMEDTLPVRMKQRQWPQGEREYGRYIER